MALSKQQQQRQRQSNGNGKSHLFKLGRTQQSNTSNSNSSSGDSDSSGKRFGSTRSSYSAGSLRVEEFERGLNGAIGDPLAQLKRWPGLQVTVNCFYLNLYLNLRLNYDVRVYVGCTAVSSGARCAVVFHCKAIAHAVLARTLL
jgi:hypothetical protein